jgi:hypothetical protein
MFGRFGTIAATATIVAALTGNANATNLLLNVSFEDTQSNPFTNQNNGADALTSSSSNLIYGWTQTGNAEVDWISNSNNFGVTTPYGNYFLDLTGGAVYHGDALGQGIQQTVVTVAGGEYSLSFYLGSSSIYGYQDGVAVTATNATLVGGPTFTSTNDGTETAKWELETLSLIATGSSTTINFSGAFGPHYIGLDNADLEFVGVAATPLPPTWTMLIAGFIGLGFFAHRSSRKRTAGLATA